MHSIFLLRVAHRPPPVSFFSFISAPIGLPDLSASRRRSERWVLSAPHE